MDFENCNIIRERAEELGLTLTDIARILDIEYRTVSRLVNGKDIRMGTMLDIFNVLGLSIRLEADN